MDVDAQTMETCSRSNRDSVVGRIFNNILVLQTAFIGDAILTLPLIQVLKKNYPNASVNVVVVPRTVDIFSHHPAISQIIPYDKRGKDGGLIGFWRLRNQLRAKNYDLIVSPHRSIRSAFLAWLLKPNVRIGFDRSAGRFLFTRIVHYNPTDHEIDRNLSLLNPLSLTINKNELPHLYPSAEDEQAVDSVLGSFGLNKENHLVTAAPGTIWNTKRWPADRFAAMCKRLSSECSAVLLVGGKEDSALCEDIAEMSKAKNVFNIAGKFSLLQSAELIKRSRVLISNDSAPMHLAVAVGTPVVAIFGATVPEYGFAPRGAHDIVIETKGLTCRPCSIHGGKTCPVGTFECMIAITPEFVVNRVRPFLQKIVM
jgi:lipopolysaccharide heptosyltransferase II